MTRSPGLRDSSNFIFVPIALAEGERDQARNCLLAQCGAPVVVLEDAMYERRMAVAGRVLQERDALCEAAWSSRLRKERIGFMGAVERGFFVL